MGNETHGYSGVDMGRDEIDIGQKRHFEQQIMNLTTDLRSSCRDIHVFHPALHNPFSAECQYLV